MEIRILFYIFVERINKIWSSKKAYNSIHDKTVKLYAKKNN
jgi:hypothetical protein